MRSVGERSKSGTIGAADTSTNFIMKVQEPRHAKLRAFVVVNFFRSYDISRAHKYKTDHVLTISSIWNCKGTMDYSAPCGTQIDQCACKASWAILVLTSLCVWFARKISKETSTVRVENPWKFIWKFLSLNINGCIKDKMQKLYLGSF